jgi:hypothetical protein
MLTEILVNCPAASFGVSKTPRNEASFGEYDPERFKKMLKEKEDEDRDKKGDQDKGLSMSRPHNSYLEIRQ